MRMPLWARRLVTRLLSVVPVVLCVLTTNGESVTRQHIAINNLMINSQVFLSLALPFSMVPLLMLTNSASEMGQFKNSLWVKILGWISVVVLIFLNLQGLPDQMTAFFSDNPTAHQVWLGDISAKIIGTLIILLLAWVVIELWLSNRRIKKSEEK